MPVRSASILVFLSLILGTRIVATDQVPPVGAVPWAHERSDLALDPAIAWGHLPNGVRYAVRSNAEPRGRISLCLVVDAGSRLERDDQQGYAHFVEHMAFKGTRHFPAGTLVKTLQRHGMAFGAEVSAFTTLTTTYYTLNLAGNSRENLAEGLQVLRDFADGVVFGTEEIRTERGVILSEWRTRESGAERIGWARLATLYANTLLARRKPIGEIDSINRADRAGLVEFYETWYRPERMVLIAVGDAEPGFLAAQIERSFGDMQPRRPAVPEPAVGSAATEPGVHPVLCTETETGGGVSIEFDCIQTQTLPPTQASLRAQLARTAAFDILGMRLQTEVKKDPVALGSAGAMFNETYERFSEATVHIESRSINWMRALVTLEHELRRALLHGFTTSEVALTVSTGLASYRYSAERAATRQSGELTADIRSDLMTGRVTQAPAAQLALVEPILNSLTPQECLDAFRALWPEDRRTIIVYGALTMRNPAKEIGEIYDSSRRFPLTEVSETALDQFAYTTFGPAGTVAEHTHVDDLNIHLVRFANGVRLNLKRTDFVAGTVVLRLRIGGGMSAEPPDKPGLGLLAAASFSESALGRHDFDAVNRIVRGSAVSLGFGVEDDAFVFSGGADSAHLRLLLQLITAYLADPGWRNEGWANAVGHLGTYYSSVSNDTTACANAMGLKMVTDRDPRYGLPRFDDLQRRTHVEVKTWLGSQLVSGPIEVGIVGDMDVEAAISLAAETLGTLPPRPARSTLRPPSVHSPARPGTVESIIASRNPKGTVWIAWKIPGVENATVSRRADVLADVLADRIRTKIREELGATYDASAGKWESQADPRFGVLIAQMTIPPGEASRLAALVRRIAADLVKGGVTEDEFQRARQPILAGLEEQLRNNSYWISYVLDRAQEQPNRLDWPRTRSRDYLAMNRDDVSALARSCLEPNRSCACIVLPKP